MARYYRTKTGLFYKEMTNGKKVRVSKEEFMKKNKKKSRRRVSRRGKGSRMGSRRLSKEKCQKKLSRKIKENMGEYHDGKYKNRQQAIAVSYSQVNSKYPDCLRYFRK